MAGAKQRGLLWFWETEEGPVARLDLMGCCRYKPLGCCPDHGRVRGPGLPLSNRDVSWEPLPTAEMKTGARAEGGCGAASRSSTPLASPGAASFLCAAHASRCTRTQGACSAAGAHTARPDMQNGPLLTGCTRSHMVHVHLRHEHLCCVHRYLACGAVPTHAALHSSTLQSQTRAYTSAHLPSPSPLALFPGHGWAQCK